MALKIKNASRPTQDDFSKVELYKLIEGESTSIQDAQGLVLNVTAWIKYETTNGQGREVEVLALMDDQGKVYSTISDTFKERFARIWEIFGEEMPPILVTGGTSKAGRNFTSCTLA